MRLPSALSTAAWAMTAGLLLASPAQAQESTIAFAGADVREDSYYGYIGLRHHLSGDILSDGVLLRGFGLYGEYEYDSPAVAGGEVDADVVAFDAMVGYQKALENIFLRGYVGLEFEDHDLSPNNTFDSNRGSDFGAKVLGEIETDYVSPFYGSLIGSYGTAKERYWARLRGGYNWNGFIFGPEGLLTGNEESDEQRIGAFVTLFGFAPVTLSLSGGYSDTDSNRGGGSAYGTLEISASF